ncbi:DUF3040 domain-containing protein [Thermobifida cellulosilytica]|uniref:DUF3040 domain-containing protein n=1 Tax=Thermobifida cellulosilytica TB100 TaxID=665004 RepID=A0A147KHT3_THECS|nr:DUF3040 domain-containing protein [Thermobifida cellulosilytica]KUP96850.1 hypothetical protein AC529_10025 [Thermobifida cellulosilytica TB100]
MALRENERRILAEIEDQLSADDPALAEVLSSFDVDDYVAPDEAAEAWKPWAVCGAIALVVVGLLVALFVAVPGADAQQESAPAARPVGGTQTVSP